MVTVIALHGETTQMSRRERFVLDDNAVLYGWGRTLTVRTERPLTLTLLGSMLEQ